MPAMPPPWSLSRTEARKGEIPVPRFDWLDAYLGLGYRNPPYVHL